MLKTIGKLRILDFDIENRPISYWRPDQPTSEITAIAWAFVDSPMEMSTALLGEMKPQHMLEHFLEAYNQADMVAGHYIRKHDLPTINAHLVEYGLPKLTPKLTCDTCLDYTKRLGQPATQEYLSEIMGVTIGKEHMTQKDWREANRLTEKGLNRTFVRVTTDVRQNILLREELLKRNLLKTPKVWSP